MAFAVDARSAWFTAALTVEVAAAVELGEAERDGPAPAGAIAPALSAATAAATASIPRAATRPAPEPALEPIDPLSRSPRPAPAYPDPGIGPDPWGPAPTGQPLASAQVSPQ